jgi:hypothetical protein
MGELEIARDDLAPARLQVNSVTLRKYAPESEAQDCCVAKIERAGKRPRLHHAWTHPGEALKEVLTAIPGVAVPGGAKGNPVSWLLRVLMSAPRDVPDFLAHLLFFQHLVEEDAPMLLLKQFRDAHVPGAACYQALVLVDMVVSRFRDGGLLPDDYQVTIEPLDGEPISRELGVAESCEPNLAFWIDFDFVVDLGNIVWQAPLA